MVNLEVTIILLKNLNHGYYSKIMAIFYLQWFYCKFCSKIRVSLVVSMYGFATKCIVIKLCCFGTVVI